MIYLYASTFGSIVRNIPNAIPIEVGAINRKCHYELRDCVGENISSLNPIYGELTGLYWIWKNIEFNSDDIIGFCHFNKYLRTTNSSLAKVINDKTWGVKNGESLIPHAYISDIKILCEVLLEKDKKLYDTFVSIYNLDGGSKPGIKIYSGQMFYATKAEFEHYCEFLFNILFEVYNRIGIVERDKYHSRYIAFLAERLLTLYVQYYDKNVIEINMEPVSGSFIYDTLKKMIPYKLRRIKLWNLLGGYKSSWQEK